MLQLYAILEVSFRSAEVPQQTKVIYVEKGELARVQICAPNVLFRVVLTIQQFMFDVGLRAPIPWLPLI
jgi:hypothetical protein